MHHSFDLDRRSLMGRMAMLIGAAATSGLAPMALAEVATGAKRYLAAPAYTLLQSVSDTIVPRTDTPGAIDAGVPGTIDALLLNWASEASRQSLAQALKTIDDKAQTQHGKGFAALSPDLRHALLSAHDAAALKTAPGASTGGMFTGPAVADPGYGKLKELIVLAYYYSEPALTHELPYDQVPGEWRPSIPLKPDTRPQGGYDMF